MCAPEAFTEPSQSHRPLALGRMHAVHDAAPRITSPSTPVMPFVIPESSGIAGLPPVVCPDVATDTPHCCASCAQNAYVFATGCPAAPIRCATKSLHAASTVAATAVWFDADIAAIHIHARTHGHRSTPCRLSSDDRSVPRIVSSTHRTYAGKHTPATASALLTAVGIRSSVSTSATVATGPRHASATDRHCSTAVSSGVGCGASDAFVADFHWNRITAGVAVRFVRRQHAPYHAGAKSNDARYGARAGQYTHAQPALGTQTALSGTHTACPTGAGTGSDGVPVRSSAAVADLGGGCVLVSGPGNEPLRVGPPDGVGVMFATADDVGLPVAVDRVSVGRPGLEPVTDDVLEPVASAVALGVEESDAVGRRDPVTAVAAGDRVVELDCVAVAESVSAWINLMVAVCAAVEVCVPLTVDRGVTEADAAGV